MTARKIIIDCDPGIDDALALVYAHGHPGLALAGLTTVAGNVSLDKTTANALRIRDFLGVTGVPVVAGSPGPLLRSAIDARDVHGESGLGQVQLPDPVTGPDPGHGADFIIDQVRAAPGEITLIAVGPLTNIALAVRRYPALTTEVSDFVIMGGSSGRGNVTPAAEFNIAADPEAAAIVFGAGWTVTMVGLDVTLRARADTAVRARLGTLGRLADDLILPVIAGYRAPGPPPGGGQVPDGPAVHDVCAVAHVAEPGLLSFTPAQVQVETTGRLTAGMTVTDFAAPAGQWNALVATGIDVPRFWDTALDSYTRAAGALQ
ncbi:MAG TPA: nucleoside hydrolase [Streptosporangiaceae bacterium]